MSGTKTGGASTCCGVGETVPGASGRVTWAACIVAARSRRRPVLRVGRKDTWACLPSGAVGKARVEFCRRRSWAKWCHKVSQILDTWCILYVTIAFHPLGMVRPAGRSGRCAVQSLRAGGAHVARHTAAEYNQIPMLGLVHDGPAREMSARPLNRGRAFCVVARQGVTVGLRFGAALARSCNGRIKKMPDRDRSGGEQTSGERGCSL